MSSDTATVAEEEYLQILFWLQEAGLPMTGANVARAMQLSAPTVHEMVGRLERDGYITRDKDRMIAFTESGAEHAEGIVRRHRLIERFLTDVLGVPWDEVHEEAERLEHHISEEFEDKIDELLGHPTACPHGDPIPTRAGTIAPTTDRPLALERSPARLIVRRVSDEDAELLRHFQALGVTPGTAIELVTQEPFEGPLVLKVGGKRVRLTPQAAKKVFVDVITAGEGVK